MCKKQLTAIADHIVPISKGGSLMDRSNVRGLCFSCHELTKAKEKRESVY